MGPGFEKPMPKQLDIYIANRHRAKPGAHCPYISVKNKAYK